jgi:threonine/homoserine/homoserine lactone efflux protein
MVTASGANFGYWRSLPHMMGIGLGLVSMIVLVAAGLGVAFTRFPLLHELLRWCGSAYLLYLAWKIATASSAPRVEQQNSQPMTFWAAAMFQYVNPKAWMMSVTAISTFTVAGDLYWQSATLVAGVFFLICFPSVSVWAGFGSVIGRWLHSSRARRVFNGVMGALTAGCVVMIW